MSIVKAVGKRRMIAVMFLAMGILIGLMPGRGFGLRALACDPAAGYGGDNVYTVTGTTHYLALRTAMAYDAANEIGKLYNGEQVSVMNTGNGTYWYVYSYKLNMTGYVNGSYLTPSYYNGPADTYVEVRGETISEEEAWDAITEYVDGHYNLDTVYDYNGWICAGDKAGSEYTYTMRSYTGAYVYFYLDEVTGEITQVEKNPITFELEPSKVVGNAFDYIY